MANRERQDEYEAGRGRREYGRDGGPRGRPGQQEWRVSRESDEDYWGAGEQWRGSGYGDEFESECEEDESRRGQRFGGSFPGEYARHGAGRGAQQGWSE